MFGECVLRPPESGTTSLSLAVTDLTSDTEADLSQLTTPFSCPRIPRTPPGERITNMDFYGADRKLSEMGDRDFTEFLDSDMFNSTVSSHVEAMCILCLPIMLFDSYIFCLIILLFLSVLPSNLVFTNLNMYSSELSTEFVFYEWKYV